METRKTKYDGIYITEIQCTHCDEWNAKDAWKIKPAKKNDYFSVYYICPNCLITVAE